MKTIKRFIKKNLLRHIAPGVFWRNRVQSLISSKSERELELLPCLSDQAKTSIDIGADGGIYSAQLLPVSRDCVAFEPRPADNAVDLSISNSLSFILLPFIHGFSRDSGVRFSGFFGFVIFNTTYFNQQFLEYL